MLKVSLGEVQEEKLEAVEHAHFSGPDFPPIPSLPSCLDSTVGINKSRSKTPLETFCANLGFGEWVIILSKGMNKITA